MSQHWQQVWQDVRGALGLPARKSTLETSDTTEAAPGQEVDQPGGDSETTPNGEMELLEAGPGVKIAPNAQPLEISVWREWGTTVLFLIGLAGITWWNLFRPGPSPPEPDVVATFSGGQITIADVKAHIALLDPDNLAQLQTPHGYLTVIEDLVNDELVRRWAKERQVDRDEEFRDIMEHITEAITLDDLLGQVHESDIPVEESEIRAYYDANRIQYRDRLDDQAREEIRHQLVSEKEDDYLADYLARLRENISMTIDYTLLDVPTPTEAQLQEYYRDNQAQFIWPATVVVDEIRLRATGDEAASEAQMNQALTRLRAGEDWATVAADVSIAPYVQGGISLPAGARPTPYDEIVAKLTEAEVSEVFQADSFFYIVRLNSRSPEQTKAFEEVRPQIVAAVQTQVEADWFEQVGERTLFTLNGRRVTANKFYHEYQSLPPEVRLQFNGSEGLRRLADQLVDRLLLAEDARSSRFKVNESEAKIEETRLSILKQMFHQEEVEDKIEVTDAEVQTYYVEHRDHLAAPPQVRISYIRIGLGQTEDDRQRALAKANEAYDKVAPARLLGGGQGLDFAEVARQYSEDEATAAQGGDLDRWIGESYDLVTELTEHPFHIQFINLPVGSITLPFEYDGSLYIVLVRERREAQPLTFEEAAPLIGDELNYQKHDILAEELTQKLLEQAQLVIYEDVLRELFTPSTPSSAHVP